MMKTARLLLCLSFLLLLTGCRKKEFSISFDVPQSVNANYRLIYYASDRRGGLIRESAVAITAGKGEFKGPTINPVLVYLFTGSKSYPLMIYAERGETITVSGEDPAPTKWKVEGNKINDDWTLWRTQNADALLSADPARINKAVTAFVEKNPENPLSTLLLLTTYSRLQDETGFRNLWLQLKGEAADPKWTLLVGRADQPENRSPIPGRLRSAAFRSLHNGTDTLRPDSAKATLLCFWTNDVTDRKEMIDSLKALAKQYPDSSSRIIADICLEPDSVTWRSSIRTDSMKNIVRLWAPAGLADSRIVQLGVPRSPFFIVITPDGHQRFRSDSLAPALARFRKILPPAKK
ncbi:MAG: DUF4369 domain-containing protein [Muribaculaceae bacterium]|nr:DUF4369 domain-containing protein [Muribaculaceae bacterium]